LRNPRWYDRFLPGRRSLSNSDILAQNLSQVRADSQRDPWEEDNDHHVEAGVTGTDNYGGTLSRGDFNAKWDTNEKVVALCDEMRSTDSQIRSMLQVIKLPLMRAKWRAEPPADGDETDRKIADFVNKALFDDDALDDPWSYVIAHILLQLDYGHSVLEKVWRVDDEGHYWLKRLAPRLPKTIRYWWVDRNGTLKAVTQYAPVVQTARDPIAPGVTTTAPRYNSTSRYNYITIPAKMLAVFSHDREGDNFEGRSVLRSVYRNYFYKNLAYHLEGVRMDRWGVGIPVADVTGTLSPTETTNLKLVLKALRANECAYVISPENVKIRIMPDGSSSGSGGSGVTGWVDHHDSQIARNVLAGFMAMSRDSHGTLGFGSKLADMFISSLHGIANNIAGTLKHQVVWDLCRYNFDMTGRQMPEIKVSDIDQAEMEAVIGVLGKLGGNFIRPDDTLENMLRRLMKLPELPPEMSRKAEMDAAKAAAEEQKKAAEAAAAADPLAGLMPPPPTGPAGAPPAGKAGADESTDPQPGPEAVPEAAATKPKAGDAKVAAKPKP